VLHVLQAGATTTLRVTTGAGAHGGLQHELVVWQPDAKANAKLSKPAPRNLDIFDSCKWAGCLSSTRRGIGPIDRPNAWTIPRHL
jgi:hypothetical protein